MPKVTALCSRKLSGSLNKSVWEHLKSRHLQQCADKYLPNQKAPVQCWPFWEYFRKNSQKNSHEHTYYSVKYKPKLPCLICYTRFSGTDILRHDSNHTAWDDTKHNDENGDVCICRADSTNRLVAHGWQHKSVNHSCQHVKSVSKHIGMESCVSVFLWTCI